MISLKRKVRYFHKRFGLYGYQEMNSRYPLSAAEYEKLLLSLKPLKKKKGKNMLHRFGRYREMERCIFLYRNTGDIKHLQRAQDLRKNLHKPYRLKVRYGNVVKEYFYRATVSFELVQKLSSLANTVTTHEAFEEIETQIMKYNNCS